MNHYMYTTKDGREVTGLAAKAIVSFKADGRCRVRMLDPAGTTVESVEMVHESDWNLADGETNALVFNGLSLHGEDFV